jgi:four helix bundle protein
MDGGESPLQHSDLDRAGAMIRPGDGAQYLRMDNPLRVMDAARSVVDEINALLDEPGSRILYNDQLRDSAQSIAANLREAYGRRAGRERSQFLRFARGSAEETDEHLRANFRAARLEARRYWPLHNRLMVILRMLTSLINNAVAPPDALPTAQGRPSSRP